MGILGRIKIFLKGKKPRRDPPEETGRLLGEDEYAGRYSLNAAESRQQETSPGLRKRRHRRRRRIKAIEELVEDGPSPIPSSSSSSRLSSSSSDSDSGSSSSSSPSTSVAVSRGGGNRLNPNAAAWAPSTLNPNAAAWAPPGPAADKGKEEEEEEGSGSSSASYSYEEVSVSVTVVDIADIITVFKACAIPERASNKSGALVGVIVEMTFPSVADVIREVSNTIYVLPDGKLPLADDRKPLAPGQKYRTKHTLTVTGYYPIYNQRKYNREKTPEAVERELTREGTTTVAVSSYDNKFFYPLGGKVQAGGPPKGAKDGVLRGCGGGVHFFVDIVDAYKYGKTHCFSRVKTVRERKAIRQAGPSSGGAGPSR